MSDRPPWQPQPGDLIRLRAAESAGTPFLLYRDDDGAQRIETLGPDSVRVLIGRRPSCDVVLDWDDRVSRAHAELERVGAEWTLADDGLSRNGTFLNGERIGGRRRLRDRDVLRVGHTALVFRAPAPGASSPTAAGEPGADGPLTPAQRRVLVALCRPCVGGGLAAPTTNEAIAHQLGVGVDAVKAHLRALFQRFGVGDLPQNQKRLRLVQLALDSGAVTTRDLG